MHNIRSLDEFNELVKQENLILFYFHSEKCSVCKSLLPKIEVFCNTNDISLCFVDAEEHPDISAQNLVMSFPGIILFYSGYEVIKMLRFVDLSILKEKIEKFRDKM